MYSSPMICEVLLDGRVEAYAKDMFVFASMLPATVSCVINKYHNNEAVTAIQQ